MAQACKAVFLKLVIVLTVLLLISLAESRIFNGVKAVGLGKKDSSIVCNSAYGQQSGETCTSIAQAFGLTLDTFLTFNPNINCDAIFVGEWVCVDASFSN